MAAPVPHNPNPEPRPDPVAPAADPAAIRASLTPTLLAVFDQEWAGALEDAKTSKDLVGIHALLQQWRHIAYGELIEPGRYHRMLAKAELIQRTGTNPDAVPLAEVQALIAARLAH